MNKNNKFKGFLSLLLAVVFIIGTFVSPIKTTKAAENELSLPAKLICRDEVGNLIYNVANTEMVQDALLSKSAIIQSESEKVEDNSFNRLMEVGGYKFGTEGKTPFDRYGFAGLNFSSYAGEWKYVKINACKANPNGKSISSDDGQYYKDRYEPQATFHERSTSNDIRSTQSFVKSPNIFAAIRDSICELIFSINKGLVSLTIALLGLSFGDISESLGLGQEVIQEIFLNLYHGFFQPMLSLMIVITGLYVAYIGIFKRAYRESLRILVPTFGIIFLTILLSVKPSLLSVPNKVANVGQFLVINAMSSSKAPANTLCNVGEESVFGDNKGGSIDNSESVLENIQDKTRSVLGCRMWAEYVFRPWVRAQWNAKYEDLDDIGNENEDWVGKPEVDIGGGNVIENWALFQVSTQTDKHKPVDGTVRPKINGVDPDWWRIVDATSNIQYKVIYVGNGSSGGSGGSFSLADKEEALKAIWDRFGKTGMTDEAIAAFIGNFMIESGLDPEARQNPGLGRGLAQWSEGDRHSTLINFAGEQGKEWTDFDAQLDFVVWELQNGFSHLVPDLKSSTDINYLTELICTKYEIAGIPALDMRIAAAQEAFNTMPDHERSDDGSLDGGGGGEFGGSSGLGGVGSGELAEIITPVKPTKHWQYWIGNEGERFANSLLASLVSLAGILAPLVFALLTSIYSIGVNLLMAVAPLFMILGVWPGKGLDMFKGWLSLVLSTIMKKILTAFLLLISIIITTSFMSLIDSLGYVKAIIIIGLLTLILLKNREMIVERLSQVNIGGNDLNLTGMVKNSTDAVKNKTKQAASTASGFVVATTIGGVNSKRSGQGFGKGIKSAGKEFVTNKAYSTNNQYMRYAMNRTSGKIDDKFADENDKCDKCGRPILKGEPIYYHETNGTHVCEDCMLDDSEHFHEYIETDENDPDYVKCHSCGRDINLDETETYVITDSNNFRCVYCDHKYRGGLTGEEMVGLSEEDKGLLTDKNNIGYLKRSEQINNKTNKKSIKDKFNDKLDAKQKRKQADKIVNENIRNKKENRKRKANRNAANTRILAGDLKDRKMKIDSLERNNESEFNKVKNKKLEKTISGRKAQNKLRNTDFDDQQKTLDRQLNKGSINQEQYNQEINKINQNRDKENKAYQDYYNSEKQKEFNKEDKAYKKYQKQKENIDKQREKLNQDTAKVMSDAIKKDNNNFKKIHDKAQLEKAVNDALYEAGMTDIEIKRKIIDILFPQLEREDSSNGEV